MKNRVVVFPLIVVVMLFLTVFGEAHAQKVLVNIWDGTEWTVFKPLLDAGKLPNAASVGPVFHLTSNMDCLPPCAWKKCCMKSQTKPQHATMLKGFLADDHGVFTNAISLYQTV